MSVTKGIGQESIEALIPELEKAQKFERKPYPVKSNWASKMGHPCERHLYYKRTAWDQAIERDWKGIGIRGNLIADWWKRYISEKGFQIIHAELPLRDDLAKKYNIGGKIDGRISWGGRPVLFEFKTMNSHTYAKINTYEDFKEAKQEWVKGYPAQIQLYLLSEGEEAGLFILCNPETLEWKVIPVYWEDDYCEYLLKRIERVNKAVQNDEPPKRITYSESCKKCEFSHLCLPDVINEGISMVDNEELEALLDRMAEIEDSSDEYDELKKKAKTMVENEEKDFIVGSSWAVRIKHIKVKRVDTKLIQFPERANYEVEKDEKRVTFVPLEKAKL